LNAKEKEYFMSAAHELVALPREPIYMVTGSKGGVGKTMTVHVVIHRLRELGKKLLVVETDTSNPDVYRTLERDPEEAPGEAIDGIVMITAKLEGANGWVDLVNAIGDHPERTVVINTAARTNLAVKAYGKTLVGVLPELGRELVAFWVINRQRDSMDLLAEHLEVFGSCTTHVVRNGHAGREEDFELYNGSKLRSRIEKAGGRSLLLPDLADRVADAIYSESCPISRALVEMPIGNRAELRRWWGECVSNFQPVWTA
jgi:CobQ/CobB/MinD/ParA nucleotide binding domain